MANHKSALKRNRQSKLRRARNRATKSTVGNAIRAVSEAIEENSVEGAQNALKVAIPAIQKAASKGVFHRKMASRKVSRLTKRVNAFALEGQSAA
ncbi:MAG: 30S ribosomal protein S20 [Desulfobulbaceae bacterium]|nr:30S ribosomal protein S20 [Desulfobulbaceae bacterium]MCK5437092.1 30S ribosomal protein S20 [Desulfobulbaceae bacterium]MCK5544433.1 30S ribosomal protein S20 [Desulfobulbaceae bacterium]